MSSPPDQASSPLPTVFDRSVGSETSGAADSAREFDGEVRTTRLGRYVLLHKLGQGGMGIVYAAYDDQLDRKVALKLLRSRSKEAQQRLLREARAMARLSHPNVAQVYEICEDQHQTFIVVEFVDGVTLRRWLDDSPRSREDIVQFFVAAGRGLAAAHAEGIVHRDFKPENVMLKKDGRALVMDFGLAHGGASESPGPVSVADKHDAAEPLTATGALMGTPAYMAPEQFAGRETDGKTDQFSFCVALWEALYGQRPFQAASLIELAQVVARGDITPPSGDLANWIHTALLRGLKPNPDDRWPSMDALLAELQHDPTRKRAPLTSKTWTLIALLGCSLAGAIALLINQTRAELEGNRVQLTIKDSELDAQRQLARDMSNVQKAQQASLLVEQRQGLEALLLAIEAARDYGPELAGAPQPVVQALFDAQSLDIVGRASPLDRTGCGTVADIDVSGDGEFVGFACSGGQERNEHPINIWRTTGEFHQSIMFHGTSPVTVALSHDGSRVVTAEGDDSKAAYLWDAAGELVATLSDHRGDVRAAVFSPDGTRIATAGGQRLRVWDASGNPQFFQDGIATKRPGRGENPIAFSPDGLKIAAACTDRNARIWDVADTSSTVLDGHTGPLLSIEYSSNGKRIITASADGSARLWTAEGDTIATFGDHAGEVTNIALAPDGSRAVTASRSQILLWDDAGNQLASLENPLGTGYRASRYPTDVAFSLDGTRILAANNDIHAWSWDTAGILTAVVESGGQTRLVDFIPGRAGFVTAGFGSTPIVWRSAARLMTVLDPGRRRGFELSFSADDARMLVTAARLHDGEAALWSDAGELVALFGRWEKVQGDLAADGSVLTLADGVARSWDAAGQLVRTFGQESGDLTAAALSRDGTHVATATATGVIQIWDRSGQLVTTLEHREMRVRTLVFSPDGAHVVAMGQIGLLSDGTGSITIALWRRTGALVEQIPVEPSGEGGFDSLAFSPDGSLFAMIIGGEIRFWETATGAPTGLLAGRIDRANAFGFSPDGSAVTTGHRDGTTRIWRLADGESIVLQGHAEAVIAVGHSPDGKYVVTGSRDKTARIWDVESGALVAVLEGHIEPVSGVAFSHDGTRVAAVATDGVARLWYMPTAALHVACARLREFDEYQRVSDVCSRD